MEHRKLSSTEKNASRHTLFGTILKTITMPGIIHTLLTNLTFDTCQFTLSNQDPLKEHTEKKCSHSFRRTTTRKDGLTCSWMVSSNNRVSEKNCRAVSLYLLFETSLRDLAPLEKVSWDYAPRNALEYFALKNLFIILKYK